MSGNPFDDLDGLDDDEEGAERDDASSDKPLTDASPPDQSSASADEMSPAGTSTPGEASDDAGSDSTGDPSSSTDGPAFPYDEVKQRPLYAREEAWNAFEDALELEVERTLREYDVRDATGRELHDAALRVAAEHPEEIANQLLELRGISINQ